MLMEAAQQHAPASMRITSTFLHEIPLFDDDVLQSNPPASVLRLAEQVQQHDAVLIITPEYNHNIPGVLKNALDWLSRLPSKPLRLKPAAMMGASTGAIGTARAQIALREICAAINMPFLQGREVLVTRAQEKFDAQGVLTDSATAQVLRDFLQAFLQWVQDHQHPTAG